MKSKILGQLSAFATMAVVVSLIISPFAVLASDISEAEWIGTVRITNNGSATTNVSVNFSLATQPLINDGFVNVTLSNTAIRTGAGADVAYMPAPSGEDAWMVFVPSVASNSTVDDQLYTGGSIDMAAKLRYFPGAGGTTTPDSANLELGSNFTVELKGYVDTTAVGSNLTSKDDAFIIFVNATDTISADIVTNTSASDNVIADGAGFYTGLTIGGSSPAATNWESIDDPVATPDNDVTVVERLVIDEARDSYALAAWTPAFPVHQVNSVTVFFRTRFVRIGTAVVGTLPMVVKPFLRLNGTDQEGTDVQGTMTEAYQNFTEVIARPGGGGWTEADIADLQAGIILAERRISTTFEDSPRVTQLYIQINYVVAIRVQAQNVGIGEHTITVNASEKIFAPANVLKFDGSATSNVNAGAIHDAAAKLWVNLWFKLDSPFSSASATDQYLWSKRIDSPNSLAVALIQVSGQMNLRYTLASDVKINITSTQNSWNADQWYHFIASISSAEGVRLRIDNGTAVTDADTTAAPNGGNVVIGDLEDGFASGIVGTIANVVVGTDDLTIGEENDLFNNKFPTDANNLWYVDEGTGTNIIDYGLDGDDATADSATVWATETRPVKFAISIDSVAQDGFARNVSVTNNANNWSWVENDALPYVETSAITVNASQQLLYDFTDWLSIATVPDDAGGDNPGTATFRTTTTDADVSALLLSFLPVTEARAVDVSLSGVEDLWTDVPDDIDQLYTELQTNHLPGATFINQMLDHAGIPQSLFWFPTVFGAAVILGFIAYWLTRSLLIQSVVSGMILALASLMTGGGIVPFWTVIVFIIEAVAVMWVTRQRAVP